MHEEYISIIVLATICTHKKQSFITVEVPA